MKCPNCQSLNIKQLKTGYYCRNCDNEFDLESSKTWSLELYENNNFWCKEAFEDFPMIIAHEYNRLRDLFKEGQTYGALMQMKDVFEVLLKFPILVVISEIYSKNERNHQENQILATLLGGNLSLGHWNHLLGLILTDNKNNSARYSNIQLIIDILSDVWDAFNYLDCYKKFKNLNADKDITNWRNNTISHGSLAFDTDSAFKKDMESKLLLIKTFLDRNLDKYRDISISESLDNNLTINIGDFKLMLFPYILQKSNGLFLFDYYKEDKERTVILDYCSSHKYSENINEIRVLKRSLKSIEGSGSTFDRSLDEGHTKAYEDVLDKLEREDDYLEPKFITNTIADELNNHQKIVLLRMERGTGKSTIARNLEKYKDFKLDTLRVYCIDERIKYRIGDFLDDIYTLDAENKIRPADSNPRPAKLCNDDIVNKKEYLATLLNWHAKEFRKHYGTDRLIIVIDGLDEIPNKEKNTIFDYIPLPEMLSENLSIVLTSRTDEELDLWHKDKINCLNISSILSFNRENGEYASLLENYVSKNLPNYKNEIEILFNKSEKRFLYLKLICECLKSADIKLKDIPAGNSIFSYYLASLEKACGSKYFAQIKELLLILACAYEDLTLEELSWLKDESKINFKFLIYLWNIKGLLNTKRSTRGTVFSINHDELKNWLKNENIETVIQQVNGWAERVNTIRKDIDVNNDGETYLFAWIYEYLHDSDVSNTLIDYKDIFSVATKIQNGEPYIYRIDRSIQMYNFILRYIKLAEFTENDLAKVYVNLGIALKEKSQSSEAIIEYKKAIIVMIGLDKLGKLPDRSDLAAAYMNLGIALKNINQSSKAIIEHKKSIAIMEELDILGKLSDRNSLSGAYMNLGVALLKKNQLSEAINQYKKAILIREELDVAGNLQNRNDLAMAYINLGNALKVNNELSEAIIQYTKAIAIMEDLNRASKLPDRNNLAIAYTNHGNALGTNQLSKAIIEHKKAIAIMEELSRAGKLANRNDLAMVYMNYGVALFKKNHLSEAINQYKKAIAIREELDMAGNLQNRNDLAMAYVNLGNALKVNNQLSEAVIEYDKAIRCFLILAKANSYYNINMLLHSYKIQVICQILIGDFFEAQETVHKALEINKTDYILYLCLAHTYLLTGNEEQALNNYRQTLELIPADDSAQIAVLADYDLFIENGWSIDLCKKYKQWFIDEFSKMKANNSTE